MEEQIIPAKRYLNLIERANTDIASFWGKEAENIPWFKYPDKVLTWNPPYARWFEGGLLNASYACLDVHMKTWRKNKVAIYWENEFGVTQTLSYAQLYREVNKFASVLKGMGIQKGDRIILYIPMSPELVIAVLGTVRIGAIHSVIFSGFSSGAIADRANSAKARMIVTADFGVRRGGFVPLKDIVDVALKESPTIEKIIVVRRYPEKDVNMVEGRDLLYHELMAKAETYVEPVPVEANHPLYILYTSGTTGKPKGVVHSTGGYLVYNYSVFKWVFNITDDSIHWCTADIGWITGHSYIVYSPLMHGTTILMYEGAPDYPDPGRWWELVEKYRVTIFYTSPTALRMFVKFGEKWPKKYDLSSIQLLGTVGEPINPEVWKWYYQHIGGERCPIVDTWWQTETGAIMISAAPGLDLVPLKPGSATFPLPGIDAEIVNEKGEPMPPNEKGLLIIKQPWPGMLMDVYGDPERYKEVYFSKMGINTYYAGDFAMKDKDGYFWLFGRADEVLKVAGHRLSTTELESTAIEVPFIAEAAAVGAPDTIKGETVVLFTILRSGYKPEEGLKAKVIEHIRNRIGPIATPREIYFVEKLPKTRSGKIMRRILKAIAEDRPVGDITTLEDGASVEEAKVAYEEFKKALK